MAKNTDPDQMPQNATSDQGIHVLPIELRPVKRLYMAYDACREIHFLVTDQLPFLNSVIPKYLKRSTNSIGVLLMKKKKKKRWARLPFSKIIAFILDVFFIFETPFRAVTLNFF